MKQRPETVLLATAGQDDEQQVQGEEGIFHAEYVFLFSFSKILMNFDSRDTASLP